MTWTILAGFFGLPGSPAEKAGLQPEDVILVADGRAIEGNGDLSRYIASKAPGAVVKIELQRGKERRSVSVTLGTFPDAPAASTAGSTGPAASGRRAGARRARGPAVG